MGDMSEALRQELRDPEYSEGYAESFLNAYIATQIRVIREQRVMRQEDLALAIGTKQNGVSRLENVNYSAWNIKTLKKIARAFHLRLKVSFETYGTLPYEVAGFSREALRRNPREKDPGLANIPNAEPTANIAESTPVPANRARNLEVGNLLQFDKRTQELGKKFAAIEESSLALGPIQEAGASLSPARNQHETGVA